MYLENVVIDAVDPQRLGRFWEAVLGVEMLTDEPDIYETRLTIEDGPVLDLCLQRVSEPTSEPPRLHLDLRGGASQTREVDRLISLGARRLDIGQRDVPWVVLADPEGNPCCVVEERVAYADTGPIAALPLDSADPDRDVRFWAWLTGWINPPAVEAGVNTGVAARRLRHPSLRGPLLELTPESAPKGVAKNRLHLDIRLEATDVPPDVATGIVQRGGVELDPGWGALPWRVFSDPSGNEFCVLSASS